MLTFIALCIVSILTAILGGNVYNWKEPKSAITGDCLLVTSVVIAALAAYVHSTL